MADPLDPPDYVNSNLGPFSNPVQADPGTLLMGEGEPGFERTAPLLSPDEFTAWFFPGIPLVSSLTGQAIDPKTLKSFIAIGVSDFESSVRIPVQPVRITDKFDFQRADDLQFSTKKLTRWPLLKVEQLMALFPGRLGFEATPPDANGNPQQGQEVDYPTSWVVPDGDSGLIRIVPNSGSLVNADISFIATTGYRSILLGGLKQWPDLWRIRYLAGFDLDKVPYSVNYLIGCYAAIKFLSALGPIIFPAVSHSISQDGIAQGMATLGPAYLQQRIAELTAERDRLEANLKSHYGTDFAFSIW